MIMKAKHAQYLPAYLDYYAHSTEANTADEVLTYHHREHNTPTLIVATGVDMHGEPFMLTNHHYASEWAIKTIHDKLGAIPAKPETVDLIAGLPEPTTDVHFGFDQETTGPNHAVAVLMATAITIHEYDDHATIRIRPLTHDELVDITDSPLDPVTGHTFIDTAEGMWQKETVGNASYTGDLTIINNKGEATWGNGTPAAPLYTTWADLKTGKTFTLPGDA